MRLKNYSAAVWIVGCVWLAMCAVACSANDDGMDSVTGPSTASEVVEIAVSTRSVTVGVDAETPEEAYTFKLYRDASCTQLMQQYKATTATHARFTFPYLEPETTYYAVVCGASGADSKPLAITTSTDDFELQRKLYSNNFDWLCWGGDYVNGANAVVLNNCTPATLTSMVDVEEAIAHSKASARPFVEGPKIVDCPRAILQLFDIDKFTCSEHVYIYPGYIRLGSTKGTGYNYITTESFFGLPDNCGVNVEMKLAPYKSSGKGSAGKLIVQRLDENGKNIEQKTISFDAAGDEPCWQDYSVTFDTFANGNKLLIAVEGVTQVCLDDLALYATADLQADIACGTVLYSDGTPIKGVAVSDGFKVVATDENGYYEFKPSTDTWYIYISIPSDCKVPISKTGLPDFFKLYSPDVKRYDFQLEKLSGGPEKEFALFCLGDPQVSSVTKRKRFANETCPSLREHTSEVKAMGLNCYGITLGDIVSSGNNSDTSGYMDDMRDLMVESNVGMPIFQVMGNHDFKGKKSVATDERNSTLELAAQRTFEAIMGPINYSFNRGDVHIIGMRDIIYNFDTKGANQYSEYSKGFTNMQFEWLKQDLALVPKDKMIVLCVHIPLYSNTGTNVNNVFKLFSEYAEAHVMSGHTHDMRNMPITNYNKMRDHVMAATCGCWWASTLCKDGAPNGYGVFFANGNTFKNWYYKGVNEGMNKKEYQMRLYTGDMIAGGEKEYVTSAHGKDALLAHVFNADETWKVYLYVKGKCLGEMTRLNIKNGWPYSKYEAIADLNAAGYVSTKSNPFVLTSKDASNDWFINGYHVGVLGQARSRYCASYNMYKYTGLSADDIQAAEVVAIDRFGNEYRSSDVISGTVGENFTYELIKAPTH